MIFSAEHQSRLLTKLKNDFDLTAQEQQILNRGRNAASRNRRDPAAYQDSTALEALIGFVYITDVARCFELMQWMDENLETDQDA
jgi:ribonuclease-3 family protein